MSDAPESSLLLDKQICFSLYSASNAMVRAYRPLLKELDLTYLQYIVMMVLWENDGIGVTELGGRVNLDSGTLTPLLKRLEAKGLLDRKISTKDERAKCLFLSSEGKQLKQQAEAVPEKILCKASVPLDQLVALKTLCDELLEKIDTDK